MKIEAEIEDPTHLRLRQPLHLEVGSVVLLDISPSDSGAERKDFLEGAAALLERAYGDDEPDYSEAGEPLPS